MKYIRTTNGVYENILIDLFGEYKYFHGEEILKEADTIEELCDEFVFHDIKTNTFTIFPILLPLQKCSKVNVDYEQFGAIWTDKGLIYVAKMNEKGELELI